MRVLVVEDEDKLADAVARGLRRDAMAVDVAYDGARRAVAAGYIDYDVVVLDRDLPEVHGDDVCRRAQASCRAEVLMLTGGAGVRDLVDGLSLGADDYLGKPFAFAELVARVRALGRRAGAAGPPCCARATSSWTRRGTGHARGPRPGPQPEEFGVLEILLGADGATVSGEEMLRAVWDEHADPFTNTVRMTLMKLRRKLGDPPAIKTVTGSGYRVTSPSGRA